MTGTETVRPDLPWATGMDQAAIDAAFFAEFKLITTGEAETRDAAFRMGDMLNEWKASRAPEWQVPYGDLYARHPGFHPGVLEQRARIAAAVPVDKRLPGLSWADYVAMCS